MESNRNCIPDPDRIAPLVRKADMNDLSRIAEIQVFNYRLYFYPIFKSDEYYFDELRVPSLIFKTLLSALNYWNMQ